MRCEKMTFVTPIRTVAVSRRRHENDHEFRCRALRAADMRDGDVYVVYYDDYYGSGDRYAHRHYADDSYLGLYINPEEDWTSYYV